MDIEEVTPLLEDIVMSESPGLDDVFMAEPGNRSKDIADLFKWSYALHLRSMMSTIAMKYCHGCRYDHPSQLEHEVCVLMPFEEQVDKWFDEALQTVDEDAVIGHWFGRLGQIHPTVRYHEVSKYLDPAYRLQEWMNHEWKLDVKSRLILLEHHPY